MVKGKRQGISWSWRWGWWPAVALLVVMALGLVVLWVEAPSLYAGSAAKPDAQATATATTRAGILAVLAATIAALAAAAALAETRRANRETHEREREAQVTDRYTKAIGQLGEKIEVRFGGIYALRRIAEDSPRDRPAIVDVLCAFVRYNIREPRTDGAEPLESHPPPTDVQAALTVIGRLNRLGDRWVGGELYGIDLSDAHLEYANLVQANLEGANLRGAHLEYATLFEARLKKADLSGAHLDHAELTGANFEQSYLRRAHLEDVTRSSGINLLEADLRGAHLERADLSSALLTHADLRGAHLEEADLSGALLNDANLSASWELAEDGQYRPIEAAHLRGTRFGELKDILPRRAHLEGAHVEGVDLSLARGLVQSQIDQAVGDERTLLPEELTRPPSWTTLSTSAGGS